MPRLLQEFLFSPTWESKDSLILLFPPVIHFPRIGIKEKKYSLNCLGNCRNSRHFRKCLVISGNARFPQLPATYSYFRGSIYRINTSNCYYHFISKNRHSFTQSDQMDRKIEKWIEKFLIILNACAMTPTQKID
jgi:hypothetical protein